MLIMAGKDNQRNSRIASKSCTENKMVCATRAQLLCLALKELGYKPPILRYFIKGK